MIDDARLAPPVLAAHVAGNTVELTWQATGTAHDAFLLWTAAETRWCFPGESLASLSLPPGTHAVAIRAVGESSIGAWSDVLVVQIGELETDFSSPPLSWCVAPDGAGSWFVVGPGAWGGVVFYSANDAAAFVTARSQAPGDFNNDGHVNSQDFFDFLARFTAGDADWNGDGFTESADLFDFLNDLFR